MVLLSEYILLLIPPITCLFVLKSKIEQLYKILGILHTNYVSLWEMSWKTHAMLKTHELVRQTVKLEHIPQAYGQKCRFQLLFQVTFFVNFSVLLS